MPFTPKFVDMVRNLTTSTGTGAVNPGSAVSGFTSLSAAVATGEQFYYCIQGVDKPAEREVGRGTMQANGTVTREAISGGLTNFTTGTKTIALVTAAEWFAKVETGGGGGSSLTVPGLTELAALPTANGAAAMLTATGREGLFVFDASNLSAKVTADTRKGIYVAPGAAPSGASGAWVRRFDGAVSICWFGTAGDFVTDDLPAFDNALAVIKARITGSGGGGSLHVPAGRYFLNGTWNVHVPVQIIGDGSGQGNAGSLLRFPNNVTGVVFNYGNTHGDGAGAQGDSTGSRMEGIQLWGGNVQVDGAGNVTSYAGGDSTSGHGLRIRTTFVSLGDVFAAFFGGDGFNINCSAGSGPSTAGNANDFMLEGCQSIYNRGFGYLANGTDANAGTFNTCSAISNGGGGFIEYSFLGNSYLQCHARDNGKVDPTGSNGPVGICSYAGTNYYVMADKIAEASTVVPGTDATVWVATGAYASVPWVTGMSWVVGGPYATNPFNVNGRNVFMGCYAESGQQPVQATAPSLFVGGLLDEVGVAGSATWLRAGANGLDATRGFSVTGASHTIRIGGTGYGTDPGTELLRRAQPGGSLRIVADGNGNDFTIHNESAITEQRGYGSSTSPFGPCHRWFQRLFVGNPAGGLSTGGVRISFIDELADLNGKALLRGDFYISRYALADQPFAYLCTVAGTYGSGAAVTALAPVGLAEASAAEVVAGSTTNRFISPDKLFDAAAPVVLADGASVTIDGSTGINFNLTIGGNRTLANPTNMKPGQSGRIRVKQDATGSRTLAYGANWLFAGGDPTLSTAANAIDVIAYFANSATEIEATIVKALS